MGFVMEWHKNAIEQAKQKKEAKRKKIQALDKEKQKRLQSVSDEKERQDIEKEYSASCNTIIMDDFFNGYPEGCYVKAYREVIESIDGNGQDDKKTDTETLEKLEDLIGKYESQLGDLEDSEEEMIESFEKKATALRVKQELFINRLHDLGFEYEDEDNHVGLTACEREVYERHNEEWIENYKNSITFKLIRGNTTQILSMEEYRKLVATYSDEQCANLLKSTYSQLRSCAEYQVAILAERAGREMALRLLLNLAKKRREILEKKCKSQINSKSSLENDKEYVL